MTVTYKPILFDQGAARPIPKSFFNELFNGQAAMPIHSGQSMNCALAFIRGPQQGLYTLTTLQCMRINFNEHGIPATWHMSMFELSAPCPLTLGNSPRPLSIKQHREPHFWFPNEQEMSLLTRALMDQYAPRNKGLQITSPPRQLPRPLPPTISPAGGRIPAAH